MADQNPILAALSKMMQDSAAQRDEADKARAAPLDPNPIGAAIKGGQEAWGNLSRDVGQTFAPPTPQEQAVKPGQPLSAAGTPRYEASERLLGDVGEMVAHPVGEAMSSLMRGNLGLKPEHARLLAETGGMTGGMVAGTGAVGREEELAALAKNKPKVRFGPEAESHPMKAHVEELTKGWKGGPEIHIVKSAEHLPAHVAADLKADGMEGKAAAFVAKDGRIYMLGDRLPDKEAVTGALYHEALGHSGLAAKYGEALDGTLSRLAQSNDRVQRDAMTYLEKNPDAYANDPHRYLRAVEEVMAQKAEKGLLEPDLKAQIMAVIKQFAQQLGMDIKLSDKEIAAILRGAQQTVTEGRGQAAAPSGNRYINIGRKGAENVLKLPAEQRRDEFAHMTPWEDAKARLDAGEDPEAVRKETGWFLGPYDKQPRFEVHDPKYPIKDFQGMKENPMGQPRRLGDVLNHVALLQAYPEMAERDFYKTTHPDDPNRSIHGWSDPQTKEFGVAPFAANPHGTLLHEMQHGIQDIEGFHGGGNASMVLDEMGPKQKEILIRDTKKAYADKLKELDEEEAAINELGGSKVLSDLAKARKEVKELSLKGGQYGADQADKDAYNAAMKRAHDLHDQMEAVVKKMTPAGKMIAVDIIRGLYTHDDFPWMDELLSKRYKVFNQRRTVNSYLPDLDKPEPHNWKPAVEVSGMDHEAYKRLGGEIEARDTSTRQPMSRAQRAETKPFSSEQYDPESVILSYNKPGQSATSLDQQVAKLMKDKPKVSKTEEKRLARIAEVQGFKGVARYMAPDELAKMQATTAKKIVDVFTSLPDAKEMASVAYSGRAKRGWYENSAKALREVFGDTDAPRFAALLAATSPQTSVELNAATALKMWTAWDKAGRPTDQAEIMKLMGQSVAGKKGEASILDAWKNNTIRALTADDPRSITLSGPKVNSFMHNLRGHVNEVTNDAWMANYSGKPQELFKQTGPLPGKGIGYKAMSAKTRQAADILSKRTGEKWTPAEVQETVWSWAKTLYEKRDAKGEDRTMKQILQAGGLTHEEIATTPDFERLFVQGVYRNILEKGGYGKQLETVERSIAGRGGAAGSSGLTGSVSSPEGAGIAGLPYERDLGRAATRLEALRKERREKGLTGVDPEPAAPISDLLSKIGQPDGGFTYQPISQKQPTKGYAVSPFPERSFAKNVKDFQIDDISDYIEKNMDMWKDPSHFVGAWHDPSDGQVYLDVSIVSPTAEKATEVARKHDQLAYFDFEQGKSVTVNPDATSGGQKK